MPLVSIVMPCYNAADFLEISVKSVLEQEFRDWELVIVNDGSTDNSKEIALKLSLQDKRIQVVSKENGGYVSARLYGYKYISAESKHVIFYDADDKLHPRMLKSLVTELENNPKAGAAYCDHVTMDEHGRVHETGIHMDRYIPTRWWIKALDENVRLTPFISIFCWTKIIEPMTLIRRSAYEQTKGWDLDFGKGQGNIGDGVYLFSEIALNWQMIYVNQPLYYYRRHSKQSSAVDPQIMRRQAEKVIAKWEERLKSDNEYNKKVNLAIVFFRYRLRAYHCINALKHQLRYEPLNAVKSTAAVLWYYVRSFSLLFRYKKLYN